MSMRTSQLALNLPSPLAELHDDRLRAQGIRLLLKRDDLINPAIPGNKWRKLKYNLAAAKEGGHRRLLTFRGAYSNHIRATAAAGHHFGFETVGIIRGEEHRPLNESLAFAVDHGMTLAYVDRTTYRNKPVPERFLPCYVLPEGGSNDHAVRGCADLPAEIDVGFDVLCCACGTGGTLAGVAATLHGDQRALGFAVLKGAHYLNDEVRRLQREAFGAATTNWMIDHEAHFGGYAKRPHELTEFVDDFQERHDIALDPVYEAKMMCALFRRIDAGEFAGTTIVAVLA